MNADLFRTELAKQQAEIDKLTSITKLLEAVVFDGTHEVIDDTGNFLPARRCVHCGNIIDFGRASTAKPPQ